MYKSEYEKEKTLSPSSFWGIWSQLMLGKLAKDTCSLMRNTIFAVLLLPLWIFPGFIINGIKIKQRGVIDVNYLGYVAINFLFLIIGTVFLVGHYPQASIFVYYGFGALFVSVLLVILLICFAFISLIEEHFSTPESFEVVSTWFTDLKKHHCSFINWKSNDKV